MKHVDDILGAAPNWAVHVHVRKVPELLKKNLGGTGGSIASGLVPDTVDALIFTKDSAGLVSSAVSFAPQTMAKRVKEALTQRGIDADVDVVAAPGMLSVKSSSVWKPLAIGLGATSVGLLLWKVFGGRR